MKANETTVQDFLSANRTQFIIPVYQRNYDWSEKQCEQLFLDIIEIGRNNKSTAHFIGSIVHVNDGVVLSQRVKELVIIDGQQRLTTITLLYIAILKITKQIGNTKLYEEIKEFYLENKFLDGDEKLKLKATEKNHEAIKFLLREDENEDFQEFSKVVDNFNFFVSKIDENNIDIVLNGLSKLMFVEISLERDKDNPQRIFESLNSTGLELSQADLIRNYILMGLNPSNQNKIYDTYWEYIERLAKDEKQHLNKVSDFIRDYLTLVNNKIPNKSDVYTEFKSKYPKNTIEDLEKVLIDLKKYVNHYNKLINAKNENDKIINQQLDYINKLEINVAYPFLMKVYDDYEEKIINKDEFVKVLELIQSFCWRRFIVGLPTNALNKIFMSLYEKVNKEHYLISIEENLLKKSGIQRFPKDFEITEALKSKDLYNIKSKNRLYFFERLENFDNNERVSIDGSSNITIEHIFPQNPDPKWKIDLKDEYDIIKQKYLHTIANLTLSGNNGRLGNKPFKLKRDLENYGYKESRLWLNKKLSQLDKWNIKELENRYKLICERFLKIWKIPEIKFIEDLKQEVSIFEADKPQGKTLEYYIFFDEKIKTDDINKMYIHIIRELFEINPEVLIDTDLGSKIDLTKIKPDDKIVRHKKINDTYYINCAINNNTKFERLKTCLSAFELEDELLVKYEDEIGELFPTAPLKRKKKN